MRQASNLIKYHGVSVIELELHGPRFDTTQTGMPEKNVVVSKSNIGMFPSGKSEGSVRPSLLDNNSGI